MREIRDPGQRANTTDYVLTEAGRDLKVVIDVIGAWAEFDLAGRRGRRLWLVMDRREVSLCLKPPGFPPDLVVRADVSVLYRVWIARIDYDAAIRCGELSVARSQASEYLRPMSVARSSDRITRPM